MSTPTPYELTRLADQLLHEICDATTGDARKHAEAAHGAIHELAYALATGFTAVPLEQAREMIDQHGRQWSHGLPSDGGTVL